MCIANISPGEITMETVTEVNYKQGVRSLIPIMGLKPSLWGS